MLDQNSSLAPRPTNSFRIACRWRSSQIGRTINASPTLTIAIATRIDRVRNRNRRNSIGRLLRFVLTQGRSLSTELEDLSSLVRRQSVGQAPPDRFSRI